MNWGVKIIIAFSIFCLATIGMVIFFMNQKVDVVTENYYEKELKYQDQIDRISRTKALKDTLKIENTGKELIVKFPNTPDKVKGKDFIHIYRPSDQSLDVKIPIITDSTNSQVVSTERLQKGYWKVQINWTSGGKEYFHESVFNF